MAINFLIALATALVSATLILLMLYVVLKVFAPNAFKEMIPVDRATVELPASRTSQSQDVVGEQAARLPGAPANEPTASDLSTEETASRPVMQGPRIVSIVRQVKQANEAGQGLSKKATSRRVAPVRASPLFVGLSPADYKEIVSTAREEQFARRQTIFVQGDPVRRVVLLTSGSAKLVQLGQSGTEVILGVRGPGEVVGTVGLRPQDRHKSTAVALASSTALVWDAAAFETLSQRAVQLKSNITHILNQQVDELEQRYREIATEKVSVRLNHQLVRLLNQLGRRVHGRLEIKLSREELAQLTGVTLFTVSRLLSDWNQRGIVSTSRDTVRVHDLPGLRSLGELEEPESVMTAADLADEIEDLKVKLGSGNR